MPLPLYFLVGEMFCKQMNRIQMFSNEKQAVAFESQNQKVDISTDGYKIREALVLRIAYNEEMDMVSLFLPKDCDKYYPIKDPIAVD